MGCVRKRGKSWNAQVRMSGWRSFTKTFTTKLDATEWVISFEKELRSKPILQPPPYSKTIRKTQDKRTDINERVIRD